MQLLQGDMRDKRTADEAVDSVSAICCAIGTTAFPSSRWAGNNGPEQTDYFAVKTLLDACPSSMQKMVYCSAGGVTKSNKLPFAILNLGGEEMQCPVPLIRHSAEYCTHAGRLTRRSLTYEHACCRCLEAQKGC